MTKKLFVPNRILAQKNINPTPSPIQQLKLSEKQLNQLVDVKIEESDIFTLLDLSANQSCAFDVILILKQNPPVFSTRLVLFFNTISPSIESNKLIYIYFD